jgi:hypothetical protein
MLIELNRGQGESNGPFMCRGSQYWLSLSRTEVVFALFTAEKGEPERIRMRIIGAAPERPRAASRREWGSMNYYVDQDRDKWIRGIQNFDRVKYESIYPGIDLVYYGGGKQLEYDFLVAPGADPSKIELAFDGARSVTISSGGELVVETPRGKLRQHAPRIYQSGSDGTRRSVAGGFRLTRENRVAFAIADYDRSRVLTIE